MSEFEQFLKTQAEIYSRFRDTSKMKEEGNKPGGFIQTPIGGYIVALRHGPEITDKVEEFALRVAGEVPALVYDALNIHTSLGVYQVGEDLDQDTDIKWKLVDAVARVRSLGGVVLGYNQWAYNQDKVMVLGEPNESFVNLMGEIRDKAAQGNPDQCVVIELKTPPFLIFQPMLLLIREVQKSCLIFLN